VGDTPSGPRLYREFQQLPSGPLEALEAITAATGPDDPDYRTPWPQDFFRAVRVDPDAIEVEVGDWSGPQVPITRAEAELFLQQVVYTVQAATHEDTLPVVFDGNPLAGFDVEGFDDARSVIGRERAAENDVLAPMSVSDPVEGLHVQGSFVARGRGNSSESNVLWRIVRGDDVVLDGFTTAEGWGDRLYPWETEPIDVSELPPGEYTFVAATDDPSGGAEGYGSFTDTRTIIVD
jgi:hypothetical protein